MRHDGVFSRSAFCRLASALALTATAFGGAGVASPAARAAENVAFVPAAVRADAEANPHSVFEVIVQGSAGGSAAVSMAIRAERRANPGKAKGLSRQLITVNGAAAELTGKQLLKLARMPGITAITPDARMQLAASLSSRQLWPFVSSVALGWVNGLSGSVLTVPAIAVVDSGVEASRPDFGGRVVKQVTMTSLPGNSPGDGRGHGTFVAGIAAGGAAGYTGASPSAKIVSLDVMNDQGIALTSDVIAAADWIYANKAAYNIRVANFSLHSIAPASVFWDPLDRAVEKLWFSGVTVVAAAGNYAVNGQPSGVPYAPGNDPFVITVGANDLNGSFSTNDDKAAPWSAYGYTLDGFAKPELAAPGRYLIGPVPPTSTLAVERAASIVAPGYLRLSGTSFAAPVVAGAAAYLLSLHPTWTPDQVKGALMLTAKPTPAAFPISNGVGEVDAARAGTLVAPPNPNVALNRFLVPDPNGSPTPVFDAASWGSFAELDASWGSASWDSASWSSASWGSASWGSTSWSSASWGTASLGSASWGSASLAAASWGSLAIADNAEGEVGTPELLDPIQESAAEAALGIQVRADGSIGTTVPPTLLP